MIIHKFFIISIIIVNVLFTFIWGISSKIIGYPVYADNHVNENNTTPAENNTTDVLPPVENLENSIPPVLPQDDPIIEDSTATPEDTPATPEAEIVPTPAQPPVATPAAQTEPPASSSSSSQANTDINQEKKEEKPPAKSDDNNENKDEKENTPATAEPKEPPINRSSNNSTIKAPNLPILASVYDYANKIPLNLNLALSALGINFLLVAGALATKQKRKAQQTTTYRPWQFAPQLRKS
ncbi:MAG: hypothetical protein WC489_01650 [Patescibacteria group bacterium]